MTLPASKLVKNQKITKTKTIGNERLTVTIRHDDECGNGRNSFSITATLEEARPRCPWRETSGGMLHDEVARFFPDLAPFLKWHLCSTDGPMHYVANSIYHASDRDCRGLRKGESRQLKNGKTGMPAWHLTALDREGNQIAINEIEKYVGSETQPECIYILGYVPWLRIGEGKEPDLAAARSTAVWPEADLEDFTEEKLLARLPALMQEFKTAVESLGLIY